MTDPTRVKRSRTDGSGRRRQQDGGGGLGGGARRVVPAADLQRDAVPRHGRLFEAGVDTDVADIRARSRCHLAGRYTLHDRYEHPRQRCAAASVHAVGDRTNGVAGVGMMRGITQRHGRLLGRASRNKSRD